MTVLFSLRSICVCVAVSATLNSGFTLAADELIPFTQEIPAPTSTQTTTGFQELNQDTGPVKDLKTPKESGWFQGKPAANPGDAKSQGSVPSPENLFQPPGGATPGPMNVQPMQTGQPMQHGHSAPSMQPLAGNGAEFGSQQFGSNGFTSPTIDPLPETRQSVLPGHTSWPAETLAAQPSGDWGAPSFPISQDVSFAAPMAATFGANPFGGQGLLRLDSALSVPMLDLLNRQSDKEVMLLQHGAANPGAGMILGAQFRATMLLSETNTANAFPYMGRFPTNFTGTRATDARLLQANQMIAAHVTPWAHGYVEPFFSDVFTFPSFNQGSFQMRQAYVVLGDLNRTPFYAFLGKKNVNFGDFGTLSPFTQPLTWHYFAPLAEGVGVGFNSSGLNVSVTGINGGRGIRVADSGSLGRLNNFAVNAVYGFDVGSNAHASIGGGYLHGTIYDTAVPEHIDPTAFGPRNSAWDINARLQWGWFSVAGEFVRTTGPWPATGDEVVAYAAESAIDFQMGRLPSRFSVSWSEGLQGKKDTQFEFNRQLVVGLRLNASPNVAFTAEYVRSSGFAPLIDITTVSNRNVVQDSIVLGMIIAI